MSNNLVLTQMNMPSIDGNSSNSDVNNISALNDNTNEDVQPGSKIFSAQKQLDPNGSFFATFVDGSSFRNLIEYLRLPTIEGVFRFRKHDVLYEQGDSDNNILNVVNLKTYELTDYEFNSKSDEIVIGVNLGDSSFLPN